MTILWAGLIFTGSSIPGPDLPEAPGNISYLVHFFEYLVLGILLTKSLIKFKSQNSKVKITTQNSKLLLIIFLTGFLYSLSDEIHQMFVPGRSFEVIDLVIDAVGLIGGIFLARNKLLRNKKSVNEIRNMK